MAMVFASSLAISSVLCFREPSHSCNQIFLTVSFLFIYLLFLSISVQIKNTVFIYKNMNTYFSKKRKMQHIKMKMIMCFFQFTYNISDSPKYKYCIFGCLVKFLLYLFFIILQIKCR